MRAWTAGLMLSLLVCASAQAADLTVRVRNAKGSPVANAVVAFYPAGGAGSARIAGPFRMTQHDMQFDPFVLIAPVGSSVAFPNLDRVQHHVYSFSPTKVFELKLYGKGEVHSVRFDKAGVAAIGCNIHDQMLAFIYVTDTPFTVKTNASGMAMLHGAPGPAGRLKIWHPYAKARGGTVEQAAAFVSGVQAVTLDVRPAPVAHGAY
jgi:plastocyanin